MQAAVIIPDQRDDTVIVDRESLLLFFLGLTFVSAAFLMTMAVLF